MPRTPRTGWLSAAAGFACTLIASCGGGSQNPDFAPDACSVDRQKEFVLDTTQEWYLFRDELPANVDIDDFGSATELLDALTATPRAEGKDRFFSFVTTVGADTALFQEGQFIGFGFRTRIEGDRLLVPDVFEGTPAELGGLARGAEITAIDSGSGYVPVATILVEDPELEEALGPAIEGTERGLQFTLRDGQQLEAVFIKRVVTIPPMPAGGTAVLALPDNPSVPVGYFHLRAFISTADFFLRNAYADFRAQGIQYFIMDLRYNGGGLVSIANLIGDLHGRERDPDDVFSRAEFNSSKTSQNSVHEFDPQPESVAPVRIAFITTGLSASASELVVNSMKPWAEVAIVGANTFGKPVGQGGFDLGLCDFRLRLVTFRLANADGESDFYEGLAPTLPFACAADDDLAQDPGNATESSTAEALSWLGTGACSEIIAGADRSLLKAQAGIRIPQSRRPSPAQVSLPGLF